MAKMNYDEPIEIAPGIFWVGYNHHKEWLQTNAYVVIEGDEAVIIDPGSVLDFDVVVKKILKVCTPKSIVYVILHHQDPDLCGSTVEFEKLSDFTVCMPERSSVFAYFYGIKSYVYPVSRDNEFIQFKTGRKLRFLMTPYCHSPGAMVTYDEKNQVLFSSDIFGVFSRTWKLYADMVEYKEHLKSMKRFMEPFMASKRAVMNFVRKVEKLPIKMICPQHGSVLRKDIPKWISELKKMRFGTAITLKQSGLERPVYQTVKKKKR